MCKAFSCIVTKDGKVFWKEGIDSHEDIIDVYKSKSLHLQDKQMPPNQSFARIEILPKDGNYLNLEQEWIYTIDENTVPAFMNDFHREICFVEFLKWKEKVYSSFNLAEVQNPFNPFSIVAADIGEEQIKSLMTWDSVRASVRVSVWDSVRASVRVSVGDSVGDSVRASVWDSIEASVWASVWDSIGASVRASVWASVGASVRDSVRASVGASVRDSVWDSIWAYVGTLFSQIVEWKYIDYKNPILVKGQYPFQSVVDLWKQGLIPVYYSARKKWMLIGKNNEGKITILWKE